MSHERAQTVHQFFRRVARTAGHSFRVVARCAVRAGMRAAMTLVRLSTRMFGGSTAASMVALGLFLVGLSLVGQMLVHLILHLTHFLPPAAPHVVPHFRGPR